MTVKLQIVGLVRFSVLSPTFYTQRFDTLEQTAAYLYAPERMELRFRLFETLCLPSLVEQSDSAFDLVVLTSREMPTPYLHRLRKLLEPHPHIHMHPLLPAAHFRLIRRGYGAVSDEGFSHRAQFRLDDDDCVDLRFIERLRKTALGLIPLQADDAPFAICGNRGFYACKTETGVEVYDTCEHAPLSTGTALVGPVGASLNPHRYNHRRFAQHYNTYSDISVPSFVRTIHGDNKSDTTHMGMARRWSEDQIETALRQHFGLTQTYLREALL
ncbi:hypothetical protein GG681_17370 [Epibacterium sp. SM1969]|uniref:Rhamnosyl transferase n=1 Tax=Tritonibacter aquimaris TaxID=2663379 RepID=A0A844B4W8_9RHOB|nr:glycosyltransferase [Tritonibacter aquimaris]MQY44416.1 hypothetical protein [Tritonibacter aquimaris]